MSQQVSVNDEAMKGLKGGVIPEDTKNYWEVEDLTSIEFTLSDKPGILMKALDVFKKHNLNLTRIQSKPNKTTKGMKTMNFSADFIGKSKDPKVKALLSDLNTICEKLNIQVTPEVPWFPTSLYDFDHIGKRILGAGDGIQDTDHPGFNDVNYRQRRKMISELALNYNLRDREIPRVEYTENEKGVWKLCYPQLLDLFKTNACEEFNWTISEFQKHVGFRADEIPQLEEISSFLKDKTGWRLKPVGGLLTQREFLNGLTFKVFHST